MILSGGTTQHLTYCLNVHRGEDWDANLSAIKTHALAVRQRVAPQSSFGLGLRLSHAAAETLWEPARLQAFQQFLSQHGLYVFTINGFPYGAFHDAVVKQQAYAPDWRSPERLAYTNRLADILAVLLPEGVPGSISTVPGSYREWIQNRADIDAMAVNLADCAEHLARIEATSGRHIALALEPEPDCLFDTTSQTVAFFTDVLAEHPALQRLACDWRRYLGVCFDTCHLSVVFDDPTESLLAIQRAGISVPKIQISAALRAATGGATAARLAAFMDPTYLHQVRMKSADGCAIRYADLTEEALQSVASDEGGEVRVHFHVPLYFAASGELRSTGSELTPRFFQAVAEYGIPHLEIETYTFNVLPAALSSLPIDESIAKEYEWALARIGPDVLIPADWGLPSN